MSKKPVSLGVFFVVAALLFSLMAPAFAVGGEACSVTFRYPVAGSQLSLYLVGTPTKNGDIHVTEDFAGYPVDLTKTTAPATLMSYVLRDQPIPLATAEVTADAEDESACSATFTDLAEGIYLMVPQDVTVGTTLYSPSPILVQLPGRDDEGNVLRDMDVDGKVDITDVTPYTRLSVVKVWKDADELPLRDHPKSVRVQLLMDGDVFDTVTLDKANNWSYVWEQLDARYHWFLLEESVPDGYTLSMSQDNQGCITMVNTKAPDKPHETPGNPEKKTDGNSKKPGKRIPQTGQLWWPVSFLVLGGICFLVIGLVRRKRG